jgi:hypothetical protein
MKAKAASAATIAAQWPPTPRTDGVSRDFDFQLSNVCDTKKNETHPVMQDENANHLQL